MWSKDARGVENTCNLWIVIGAASHPVPRFLFRGGAAETPSAVLIKMALFKMYLVGVDAESTAVEQDRTER